MKRRLLVSLVVLAGLLSGSSPASAGGWAIAELVEGPGEIVAGETVEIDVQLLQHGVTPMAGAQPEMTLIHRTTGTQISVDGDPVPELEGVYRFQVNMRNSGSFKWRVTHSPLPGFTSFPTLYVVGTDSPDATPESFADPVITMVGLTFAPASLQVSAGTTVTWINTDMIPHQVASTITMSFDDSPMLGPGESYSWTFLEPGVYTFTCGPHQGMSGNIMVV